MSNHSDVVILRDLGKQVAEIAASDAQEERRELWRRHNALEKTDRVPIYIRWFAAGHECIDPELRCEDPFFRGFEKALRSSLFQQTLDDDYVIEPWVTLRASMIVPEGGTWGLRPKHIQPKEKGGAWHNDPPIKELDDAKQLVAAEHRIDEEATARNRDRLREALGDTIEVNLDRGPVHRVWQADISTDLGHLRGIEEVMWDMMDNPEWLHGICAFMRDTVLASHQKAEDEGDWSLANSENQSMPYARDLPDPKANSHGAKRKDLWVFLAAQEMTLISPEMHDEFLFEYQFPIMEHFGLSAYGCCEDLSRKIPLMRKLKNLRRIAVTPVADVPACAEHIGTDYIASWRPNPAEMVCCGFDEARIRDRVRKAREAFDANGCLFDVCLKDVQTVEGDPNRLREFVRIVREECAR